MKLVLSPRPPPPPLGILYITVERAVGYFVYITMGKGERVSILYIGSNRKMMTKGGGKQICTRSRRLDKEK